MVQVDLHDKNIMNSDSAVIISYGTRKHHLLTKTATHVESETNS